MHTFVYAHVVYANIRRIRIIDFTSLKPAKTIENNVLKRKR